MANSGRRKKHVGTTLPNNNPFVSKMLWEKDKLRLFKIDSKKIPVFSGGGPKHFGGSGNGKGKNYSLYVERRKEGEPGRRKQDLGVARRASEPFGLVRKRTSFESPVTMSRGASYTNIPREIAKVLGLSNTGQLKKVVWHITEKGEIVVSIKTNNSGRNKKH